MTCGRREGWGGQPITSVLLCSVICSLVFRLSEFLAEMQHVKVIRSKVFCHKGWGSLFCQFVLVVNLLAVAVLF